MAERATRASGGEAAQECCVVQPCAQRTLLFPSYENDLWRMKLQFDPNQQYQLDAVAAVTDIFDGQPQGAPEYAVIQVGDYGGLFAGQSRTELGVGNRLFFSEETLLSTTYAAIPRLTILWAS